MSVDFEDIQTQVDSNDEWANYQPPSQFMKPVPRGVYSLMRDLEGENNFSAGTFEIERTGEEHAWFNFKNRIVGGEHNDRVIFGGVNTMVSTFRPSSSVQDFIFSARSPLRPRASELIAEVKKNEELGDGHPPYLLEKIVGPYKAQIDGEWRCRTCEETFLKGLEKPKAPKKYALKVKNIRKVTVNGKLVVDHIQVCPKCNQEVGANNVIRTFLPSTSGPVTSGNTTASAPVAASDLPPAAG